MNFARLSIIWIALLALLSDASAQISSRDMPQEAQVLPGYEIQLPRDGGSHPDFGAEWWYLTGWLQDAHGARRGFQVTFFRSRNAAADANPSKFSPKQLLFAHAAISDPQIKKLLRAERSARAGFGLAEAEIGATDVWIDDWSLRAAGADYTTNITADNFSLTLTLKPTPPPLLQGDHGISRKGPSAAAASYYYSLPQLQVQGSLTMEGHPLAVTGSAWFDHEWSSEYLDADTVGWDWLAINFLNGDALMTFRMRDTNNRQRWAGGAWRIGERSKIFSPAEIKWTALHQWQSPRTGVKYPIAWRVQFGDRQIVLRPLMDDQENDARGSVGVLYWEGAVEAMDDEGKVIGRGYLELTGYGERLRM